MALLFGNVIIEFCRLPEHGAVLSVAIRAPRDSDPKGFLCSSGPEQPFSHRAPEDPQAFGTPKDLLSSLPLRTQDPLRSSERVLCLSKASDPSALRGPNRTLRIWGPKVSVNSLAPKVPLCPACLEGPFCSIWPQETLCSVCWFWLAPLVPYNLLTFPK